MFQQRDSKSGKVATSDSKPQSYLVESPQFEEQKTNTGVIRTFTHWNGQKYRNYTSHDTWFGMPILSRVSGIDPETGRSGIARGFIAVGPKAQGVFAIGQFADGYFAIGQMAIGRVFALGQVAVAPLAIGQAAVAFASIGQLTASVVGIGQIGIAGTGIFQIGVTLWGGIAQKLIPLM